MRTKRQICLELFRRCFILDVGFVEDGRVVKGMTEGQGDASTPRGPGMRLGDGYANGVISRLKYEYGTFERKRDWVRLRVVQAHRISSGRPD